jgi:hypothetical protein
MPRLKGVRLYLRKLRSLNFRGQRLHWALTSGEVLRKLLRLLLHSLHLLLGAWGQLYAHELVVVKTTSTICDKNHKPNFKICTLASGI